ncbi:MAG: M42 family metallopeptidase [Clostridia bacterium]|nr:M42 family metallopeptidase [Clostridia bacterium]
MGLLKTLTQAFGTSGCENNICEILRENAQSYCDEISVDALGNLIAHKKGNGKKVMISAHMDEIGIIVTFIDKNGFIRFSNVGGLYTKQLVGRRVRFENGTIGVIGSEEEDFEKKAELSKLFIDIGEKSEDNTKKYVNIGDMASFEGDYYENSNIVISKALDNRVGCYILLEAMRDTKTDNDLYFVFSSQEEVGLRGAKASAYSINPDYAIAVDVTDTGDCPSAPSNCVKLGGGAAIKIMDRSVLCDSYVRGFMIDIARENNIPYQLEIMTDGGTDAGAMHLSRGGVKTGGISVPTRYIHSPSEMASVGDIKDCIRLLKTVIEKIQ